MPAIFSRIDPWVLGIVGTFAILFAVYAAFITVALQQPLQIEASYSQTGR